MEKICGLLAYFGKYSPVSLENLKIGLFSSKELELESGVRKLD